MPSATPPATALLAGGESSILALGWPDPDWQFLPLAHEHRVLEFLPLDPTAPVSITLDAEPIGWSFDGQLFAYLSHSGDIEVLAPTLGLTTTMITATVEHRPVGGVWIHGTPLFAYLSAEGNDLALRLWRPNRQSVQVERFSQAQRYGAAALPVSPAGHMVVAPLLRQVSAGLQRELVLIGMTEELSLTLATAPGEGPLAAVWGPQSELAFSTGETISLFFPARGSLEQIDLVGLPQDWGPDGLLVVTPAGELLRWREGAGGEKVWAAGEVVRADYLPNAARWIGRETVAVLYQGKVYKVEVRP